MGYIYTEITSTTFDDFIVELEEKTGIVVKKTDGTTGSGNTYSHLTIQFPGKEEVQEASLEYSNSNISRVFADIDNELLITKSSEAETSIYKGDARVYAVLYNVTRIYNGKFQKLFSYNKIA